MCDATTCIGCSKKSEIREEKKEKLKMMLLHLDDDMSHHKFLSMKMEIMLLIDEIE